MTPFSMRVSRRQREAELDEAVVEERQARLDRVRHRVAVAVAQERGEADGQVVEHLRRRTCRRGLRVASDEAKRGATSARPFSQSG